MEPRKPRCTACGYDLSGIAAAWEDRCPIFGVCPECGGKIDWAWAYRYKEYLRYLKPKTLPGPLVATVLVIVLLFFVLIVLSMFQVT